MRPVIFSTLYPENVDAQRARLNSLTIVGILKSAGYVVNVVAGSAHRDAAVTMTEALTPHVERCWVMHIPFIMQPLFADRRPIEISFSKQILLDEARHCKDSILLFVDSDVCIDPAGLVTGLRELTPTTFINFPYVLRRSLAAPKETLGAFAVLTDSIMQQDVEAVYKMKLMANGKIGRVSAPDCCLRSSFIAHGLTERREVTINSWHYDTDDKVMHYAAGKCTEEKWKAGAGCQAGNEAGSS